LLAFGPCFADDPQLEGDSLRKAVPTSCASAGTIGVGGKPHCFTLRQQGATVQRTRDDGLSGVATIQR
jgi:hypothetical protein